MNSVFPSTPLDEPLRIAFFGTPEFAATCLEDLYAGPHEVVAVITAPDKKAGRGQRLQSSQVKVTAQRLELPVLQPHNLKAPEFIETFRSIDCDLAIVVAFRMLPEAIWNSPRYGSVNLHASLLPQLRGAAPIQWAIRHGLPETGVTTFSLQQAIDTGDILLQQKVDITSTETAKTLHDKLLNEGVKLITKTIDELAQGQLTSVPQAEMDSDKNLLSAPKLTRENCRINWTQSTESVSNMIRSLNPYPTGWCHTPLGDIKVLNVESASIDGELPSPGTASIEKGKLYVSCLNGWVELTDIIPIGKRAMRASDWINGLQADRRNSLGVWG